MPTPVSLRKHRRRVPFRVQIVYGGRGLFGSMSFVMADVSLFGPLTARTADNNGLLGASARVCQPGCVARMLRIRAPGATMRSSLPPDLGLASLETEVGTLEKSVEFTWTRFHEYCLLLAARRHRGPPRIL